MLRPAYQTSEDGEGNHRELDYRICTVLDMTQVVELLNDLVGEGMEPAVADIFLAQADVLVASLRTENNRLKPMKRG